MANELEVLREFCGADRAHFDPASIAERPSRRSQFEARWSDGSQIAIEVAEARPGGGMPPVFDEFRNKPDSSIPVDLLIYCETYPPPIMGNGNAREGLWQLEIDLLLSGGKPNCFRRIWMYERSTTRILCCFD